MKKKIILHGYLRDLCPHDIEVEAGSVAEALRALSTIEALKTPDGRPHPVEVDGIDTEVALFSITDFAEIHVRPRASGAGGRGGFLQILIGVVMVGLAVLQPELLAGLVGHGLLSYSSLFMTGALMITGGLLSLLLPTPADTGPSGNTAASRTFSGSGNSVAMGTPIPLAYGFNLLGGQYLSYNVDALDWSGTDAAVGTATTTDQVIFTAIDKPAVLVGVVCPIYAAATPSLSNLPTSGWLQ